MIYSPLLNRHQKPIVTVLGSCRQDSIYEEFKVTKIRDHITYPHYTKEILQLINYCGFGSPDRKIEIPKFVFRNNVLAIPVLGRRKAYKQFKKTDIFLVEIASLLEYKYGKHYLHHEIYDNWGGVQNLQIKKEIVFENIEVQKQPLNELKADMLMIAQSLGKEKVIFATHLSTRDSGTRADLVESIKSICREYEFDYFDPKILLENYSIEEIAVNEEVLSHFSDLGHKALQQRYRNIILDKFYGNLGKNESLIQKYIQEKGREGIFPPGFGDLIQGTILTYEIAKRLKRVARVDISETQLTKWLTNTFNVNSNANYISHSKSYLELLRNPIYFTNKRWLGRISDQAVDFARETCLSPNDELKAFVTSQKKSLGLSKKEYSVLHVRLIDGEREIDFNRIKSAITSIPGLLNTPVLLLSNSHTLCQEFSAEFIVTDLEKIHISDEETTELSAKAMLAEFMLMSEARNIYSISEYEWGSSFAQTAALLFRIPISSIILKATSQAK